MLDQKAIQEMPLKADIDTRKNGQQPFSNPAAPVLQTVIGSLTATSTAFSVIMSAFREIKK